MATLQFLGIPQSTYTRVVCMAAQEKGVSYEIVPSPPHSDGLLAVSPLGKVPGMRHGSVELFESSAICRYIDAAFDGPPLYPSDPAAAAVCEQWVSVVNSHMDRTLIRQYLFAYIFPKGDDGKPDMSVVQEVLPAVEKELGVLDKALAGTGYLAGGSMTAADLNLTPILHYLTNTPEAGAIIGQSVGLSKFLENMRARPSFAATEPPAQAA